MISIRILLASSLMFFYISNTGCSFFKSDEQKRKEWVEEIRRDNIKNLPRDKAKQEQAKRIAEANNPYKKKSGILYVSFKFDIDDSRVGKSISIPIFKNEGGTFVNSGNYNMSFKSERFCSRIFSMYDGEKLHKKILRKQDKFCKLKIGNKCNQEVWVECPETQLTDFLRLIQHANIYFKKGTKLTEISTESKRTISYDDSNNLMFSYRDYREENGVKQIKVERDSACGEEIDPKEVYWTPIFSDKGELKFTYGFAPC